MADRVGKVYMSNYARMGDKLYVHPLKKDAMHQLMIAKANGQLWKCTVFFKKKRP